MVVKVFAEDSSERFDLSVDAVHAEVTLDFPSTVHVAWIDESGLWYGLYDDGTWSQLELSAEKVERVLIVSDGFSAHIVYTQSIKDADTNLSRSELIHRMIDEGEPGAESLLFSSKAALEHMDLTLEDDGVVRAGFVESGNAEIILADWSNGEWALRNVPVPTSDPGPLALASNTDQGLCVAFIADQGQELWYGRLSEDEFEPVASSEYLDFYFGVDLGFRKNGEPRFFRARYRDRSNN